MADVELLRAENKRLANALQSLLRYVERCREAGVLVCDDIGPEEFARYELEQALSLPPEQPAAAQQGQAVEPAPPSAPVGVEGFEQWYARVDARFWNNWDACNAAFHAGKRAALAQQPAAVDEAMVERAWVAFCEDTGPARAAMRAALTAALATQHQEPKS